MLPYVLLNKPVGYTPLDLLLEFKKSHPEYANQKLSYAGRLDPMAEGLLLVLVGDENQNRDSYLGLPKEYEVTVLFGIETDSYDTLGLIQNHKLGDNVTLSHEDIQKASLKWTGKITQDYPLFSSKTVGGKPLYWWAREGKIKEIDVPSDLREISAIKLISFQRVDFVSIVAEVKHAIDLLKSGKFRQRAIIKQWEKMKYDFPTAKVYIAKISVSCSSGTYMRTLARDLGRTLGVPACALHIKRLKIGPYELDAVEKQ